jgi:glyoxylase-like metal-dependent hydrolase (beta-lactamase superfamily II)
MSRFFSKASFDSVNADVRIHDDMALDEYGADVRVFETPGHTPGSVSIVTPAGDAIIGDVIMGGYMGGIILPGRPNFHYFADNVEEAMMSLDKILARTSGNLYVGHGGPLVHDSVVAWRKRKKPSP